MKTLLSLFDYSGRWSEPYLLNGWNVIQWDIKLDEFMDINLIDSVETALDLFDCVDGILAGVPCTDFTVSGAQYWSIKDANGTTAKSVELVRQVQRLADLYTPTDPEYIELNDPFFWAIENPVGRMGKLTGLSDPYYFHPYEFAAYNNVNDHQLNELDRIRAKDGHGVTAEENILVLETNAYTKKTGLWGQFNRNLEKKPIPPVKTAPQGSPIQRLGGSSAKTKELRSITPSGFAWAFYYANSNNHQHDKM